MILSTSDKNRCSCTVILAHRLLPQREKTIDRLFGDTLFPHGKKKLVAVPLQFRWAVTRTDVILLGSRQPAVIAVPLELLVQDLAGSPEMFILLKISHPIKARRLFLQFERVIGQSGVPIGT